MTRTLRLAILAGAVLTALAMLSAASAAPPGTPPGLSKHQQVVDYWTPARVAHAIPRDFALDPSTGQPTPAKKPSGGGGGGGHGGGGGGGGGGTSVTGATWTGGGLVVATTGKVLFTMAGVDYVCSGSVVQDASTATSLILTAGHCAYDEVNLAFATNWMFVPDYENGGSIITNPDGSHSFSCDTVPYGCWTAEALVTTTAWATGNDSLAAFNSDWAFAVVGPGGKTGESNQLDATVGAQAIAFNQTHPTNVYAFGYPQASPYNGQSLIYCAGTDVADTWGGTNDFGLNCDMTGGSSGGPWFVGFDAAAGTGAANSLNSFKYTRGPSTKYMFGPYFNGYTQATYTAAESAAGDTLVAP
jgi:hypothetical protein